MECLEKRSDYFDDEGAGIMPSRYGKNHVVRSLKDRLEWQMRAFGDDLTGDGKEGLLYTEYVKRYAHL